MALPTAHISRPGQIRRFGPALGLLFPLMVGGLAAAVFYGWPCTGTGCVEPALAAYVLVLIAVPTALTAGLPWFFEPYTLALAAATSAVGWVLLGRWASRRATADIDATWRTYWAELAFMSAGIGLGVIFGLVAMRIWIRF